MNERKANELSIFEKAERYDRAIERARNHHDRDGLTLEQYETIDIIFPELKESEDEKIRKGAITSIKRFIEYTEEEDCAPDIKDMLIKNAKKQIAWLEKQGEKSTGEEMKEALRTEYEKGRADAIAEMLKPAWSEEDEYHQNIILYCLSNECVGKTDKENAIDWFKSLKDRIGNFDEGYKVGFSAAKYNQWKPSERQLQSLEMATKYYMSGKISKDYTGKDLSEILNELKKLKGE